MVNLLAKLDLDSTGFFRGLSRATDGAKKAGDKIGQEVGKDFTNGLKRTVGAAAVVGAALSAFRNAQEIRNTAAALGISAQEFAAMEHVAQRLGDTTNVTTDEFRRLTDEVLRSGIIADENALQSLASDADIAERALKTVTAALTGLLALAFTAPMRLGDKIAALAEGVSAGRNSLFGGSSFRDAIATARAAFANADRREADITSTWLKGGDSIAKSARRTTPDATDRAKAESTARAEREERRRLGLPSTPFAERNGGSLASIGLGPGLGTTFNLQRQMLDELRRLNAANRAMALEIRRANGGPL